MKKKIMKAGILIVVFCAAVIISSLVINKDVSDEAADMGAASLPEISFYVGETEVNPLFGYVNKMEIPAVRDTITPLKSDGSLTVKVEKYGNKIDKLKYEVYSLDGRQSGYSERNFAGRTGLERDLVIGRAGGSFESDA